MRRWLVALSLAAVASQLLQVAGEEADEDYAAAPGLSWEDQQAEDAARIAWIQEAPHKPSQEFRDAIWKAAWYPANNSANPAGVVMLTQGNYHALQELLPRWLDSLASTRDGDLTQHAVVVALGASALDLCQRQKWNHGYSHQCVLDQSWPGPDRQYEFASPWYVAVTLHKVELILTILQMGASPFWLDTDVVFMGSAMPYLSGLEADIAVSAETCGAGLISPDSCPQCGPNTGVLYLKTGPPSVRFASTWLGLQRQHLLEWDVNYDWIERRSDQVTFAKYALPKVIGNATHPGGDAYVNVTMLSNDLFPNWCGGQCGCEADAKRGALKFLRHENLKGHLTTGRIFCGRDIVKPWLLYHFPCAKSTHEKLALIDAYQSMHNLHLFKSERVLARSRRQSL